MKGDRKNEEERTNPGFGGGEGMRGRISNRETEGNGMERKNGDATKKVRNDYLHSLMPHIIRASLTST